MAKIAGFKAEPLLLRAGDYYWEKKIERMADSDHAPGEMIVGFPAGTPTGTAREILASYGYSGDRIQQSEYMPQWYTVRFRYEGDDRDELVRAIRELLLDKRIEYADPNGLMTMSTPVEGVITVTFNIGVTAVEAEAVIAAHNCRILESFESERLSYRLRVHKGRNEYEVAEEFRAEPTVSGAAQDVLM